MMEVDPMGKFMIHDILDPFSGKVSQGGTEPHSTVTAATPPPRLHGANPKIPWGKRSRGADVFLQRGMGLSTKFLQGLLELPAKPNPHNPLRTFPGVGAAYSDVGRIVFGFQPEN